MSLSLSLFLYMYVCIYIHIYVYVERERERDRERDKQLLIQSHMLNASPRGRARTAMRCNTRNIQYMAVQYKGGVQYMTSTRPSVKTLLVPTPSGSR